MIDAMLHILSKDPGEKPPRKAIGTTFIRLQPSQLAALDGWIANQDASLTSDLPNLEKAK